MDCPQYHTIFFQRQLIVWIFFLASFLTDVACAQQSNSLHVYAPNKKIQCDLKRDGDQLKYQVSYNQKVLIKFSNFGVTGLPAAFNAKTTYTSDTLQLANAENAYYIATYNELNVDLGVLTLFFRVYNDGIAFRFIAKDSINNHFIESEFMFAQRQLQVYQQKIADTVSPRKWRFINAAENLYEKVSIVHLEGSAELPLLVEGQGWSGLIHEASNTGHPPSLLVKKDSTTLLTKPVSETTRTMRPSPWRYIIVAPNAAEVLQKSNIIYSLNEPSKIEEPSWIEAGKAFRDVTLNTSSAMRSVDFCQSMDFKYLLLDAGWYGLGYGMKNEHDPTSNALTVVDGLDLQKVVKYAASKNIGVILYVNLVALRKQLDSILPIYKSWGIKGLKFGFVDGRTSEGLSFVQEAVQKAAQYQFIVDIHDNYKPTGLSRTYPNLLTQEGIRGGEYIPDATHNTILPFARYSIGAADYTILYKAQKQIDSTRFLNEQQLIKLRKMPNTRGHQIALSVIYFSPLQLMFWYGIPEIYDATSTELSFFKKVPTTWDESRVLQGDVGKYIAIARRKKNDWYLGVITNTERRIVTLRFDFLPKGKKYKMITYADDKKDGITTKRYTVNSSSALKIQLRESGGQAAIIVPFDSSSQ